MIPVLTADEMRRADRLTIEEIGLPGVVLMDNENANSLMYLPIDQLMKQVPGVRHFSGSNGTDNESQGDTEGEQTVRPTRRSREAR